MRMRFWSIVTLGAFRLVSAETAPNSVFAWRVPCAGVI